MSGTDWMVVAAGVAAIAWVNWYFLFAERRAVAAVAPAGGGVLEVPIVVDGGYDPAVIRVKAGAPVRLVFDRRDRGACSEEVVFPSFGIRRFLAEGKRTPVELTPDKPGTYDFTCGMSMLHGKLVAE